MPAARRDAPKQVEETPVAPDQPKIEEKEGKETITVNGQSLACTWHETTMPNKIGDDTMTTVSKVWVSEQVPGGTAKMESETKGKVGGVDMASKSSGTVTWANG